MPDQTALRPLLLRPDNLTPPARTPWGGRKIIGHFKADAGLDAELVRQAVVGESWEISVEPSFPSRLAVSGALLAQVLASDPQAMIGAEAARGRTATALLVKLLDAAEALSVQIHPSDTFAGLASGESGKPETWYILDREPGAGIYLGLEPGVTATSLRAALEGDGDVSEQLTFVPVEPGDFFVIEAGTPHAIGAGVTLVEPQHVIPGRRGVTYRFYDWQRRYDALGRPDPSGRPRPLHVEQAMAVTRFGDERGDTLLARIRGRHGQAPCDAPATMTTLCGGEGLANEHLTVVRIAGTGHLTLDDAGRLRGLTVVAGHVDACCAEEHRQGIAMGYSAVLPAAMGAVELELHGALAIVAMVT